MITTTANRAWNIRRAKIAAYQHGVEFGRADRPDRPDSSTKGDSFEDLDSIMAESIRAALVRNGGNRTRAAKELGITRRALLRQIDKYDIDVPVQYGPGKKD